MIGGAMSEKGKKRKELPRSGESRGYVIMDKHGLYMQDHFLSSLEAQSDAEKLVEDQELDVDEVEICELVPVSKGKGRVVWYNAAGVEG